MGLDESLSVCRFGVGSREQAGTSRHVNASKVMRPAEHCGENRDGACEYRFMGWEYVRPEWPSMNW